MYIFSKAVDVEVEVKVEGEGLGCMIVLIPLLLYVVDIVPGTQFCCPVIVL
jgi:hypothetical protein